MKDIQCGIYKYVYKNQIIYVGKTDHSLAQRIFAHQTEEKFQPYIDDADIYYFPCKNAAETTIYETYLINKYKPCLNDMLKYHTEQVFQIPEKQWIPYGINNIWDFTEMTPKEQLLKMEILGRNIYERYKDTLDNQSNRIEIISDSELPYMCVFPDKKLRLMLFESKGSAKNIKYYTTYSLLYKFLIYYHDKMMQYQDFVYQELYLQKEKLKEIQRNIADLEKELQTNIFPL